MFKLSGSVGSGVQTSTLVVGSTHTTQSTTFKCKAVSSTYPQSAAGEIAANLNVFGEMMLLIVEGYYLVLDIIICVLNFSLVMYVPLKYFDYKQV